MYVIGECGYYKPIDYYDMKSSGNTKDYYYKINVSNTNCDFIYVKYQGTNPKGSLYARSS